MTSKSVHLQERNIQKWTRPIYKSNLNSDENFENIIIGLGSESHNTVTAAWYSTKYFKNLRSINEVELILSITQ